MQYVSTREGKCPVSAAQAIVRGISPDGGLYVPLEFPVFTCDEIASMEGMRYTQLAAFILRHWLVGFADIRIASMCEAAYQRFTAPRVTPVHSLDARRHVLELYHGPTSAFKDVALQLLPHLLVESAQQVGEQRDILILVATSGDTGKAALEGFADVPGVRICVFYPEGGVSEVQRLQMATQQGENTHVVAVHGNFDDAQSGVKRLFTDPAIAAQLDAQGVTLSSANSINLGRLIPQIVYYFSAYAQLTANGAINSGDAVNIVVPTGNFGNILAAAYAKNMGLPVKKLVCASNSNNVLSEFIQTGVYDSNREFHLTTSPSMDILISSNLERMLYEIAGRDAGAVQGWMNDLKTQGRYEITGQPLETLQNLLWGDWAGEEEVAQTIAKTWRDDRYLIDPHTAVALCVHQKYVQATGDDAPAVIASTASPYKFGTAVLGAVLENPAQLPQDEFECLNLLAERSGQQIPEGIASLKALQVRHTAVCDIQDMAHELTW